MLGDQAAKLIGISRCNVTLAVQEGRLEGQFGWPADGGYRRNADGEKKVPALPRVYVTVTSVKEACRIRAMPSLTEAAARVGMGAKGLQTNFLDTGQVRFEITKSTIRVNSDDVEALISRLHDAVHGCVHPGEALVPSVLRARFNKRHGGMFVHGKALPSWIDTWVDALVEQGRLRGGLDGVIRLGSPASLAVGDTSSTRAPHVQNPD